MNQHFILKSYHKGLSIQMNEDIPLEILLEEIGEKFNAGRAFFGSTQVALSLSGKKLTDTQKLMVVDAIQMNSDLDVVAIAGEDEKLQMLFDNGLARFEIHKPLPKPSDCNSRIEAGTLKKGQLLESEHSIIILGDVNPGARVITDQDVIILGSLLGEVNAGRDGEDGHFIAALDMSPERIRIGDFKYHKNKSKKLWPDTGRKAPKIAYVKDNEVVLNSITKELLGMIVSK